MEQKDLYRKIEQSARTIFTFCLSRTSSKEEAEDLCQDILAELLHSSVNLKDDNAFYGFMWSVARNVYKNWCKKKRSGRFYELDANLEEEANIEESIEANIDMNLLKRELALLSDKFRKATVLYYFEELSVKEISSRLDVSESMVKYLLFKARKILKEGMQMERYYGDQSYNPKRLSLHYWGSGLDNYYNLSNMIISQNILMACYNDKLSIEEISLQTGVPAAYLEDDLEILVENDFLRKSGNKYYTNIVIFTREFSCEVSRKTHDIQKEIATIVMNAITENELKVRNLNFHGSDMDKNTYNWQMTCLILYKAIVEKLQGSISIEFPKTKTGAHVFVWGVENFEDDNRSDCFGFGISNVSSKKGDYMQFMDFPINNHEMVHHYFCNNRAAANVYFDIVNGKQEGFSDNDIETVAEMINMGYLIKDDSRLVINCPVYTKEQYIKLNEIFDDITTEACSKAKSMIGLITDILLNHTPLILHDAARQLA